MNTNPNDKILVIAPHPDDESLGCGGLMIKYAKHNKKRHHSVWWHIKHLKF